MSDINKNEQHLYLREINPDAEDSLAKIVKLINPGSSVLDVGSGPGTLGKYLAENMDCVVDGVEYNVEAAKLASTWYRRVEVVDLEVCTLPELFAGGQYEYIVCADVLEHLRDPGFILSQLPILLKPEGRILISIPNVGYAGLLAGLLAGDFRYGPEGLMDKTHLRFFTRSTLLELLGLHHLVAKTVDVVTIDIRESEFSTRYLDSFPPGLAKSLLARPDAMAYQFIVDAVVGSASVESHVPAYEAVPELRFSSQLYWKADGQNYDEKSSCFAYGQIGLDRQEVCFSIPASSQGLERLRLDISDRPGLLQLHEMRLDDGHGNSIWQWDKSRESLESVESQGSTFASPFSHSGATILLSGDDPFFEVPVDISILECFTEGGDLCLTLGWPMSMDTFALAQFSVPKKDLQTAQANISVLEQQVGQLYAQIDILEGEKTDLQNNAAELQREATELEFSVTRVTDQRDLKNHQLEEIYGSTIWRWSRPYVRGATWFKQRVVKRGAPASIEAVPLSQPRSTALVVDIIVPVYKGLNETRRCLTSAINCSIAVEHQVVVINDASPEPELVDYLAKLADSGEIALITNEVNSGFVQSVNRGMALHPDHDVVLLNSDTEVAGNWLDRLANCAYVDDVTGTVTPFSNNATICSYPQFCQDNAVLDGWSPAELDTLFSKVNAGRAVRIPTAVGFCMYIRRDCLQQTGLFDVESFGRGYGEENDFCMRATHFGWQHSLCGDVFVFHEGGVSFAEAQDQLKSRAMDTLRRLHPEYDALVHEHLDQDPAQSLRMAVDAARLMSSKYPRILVVSHGIGGGTDKHIAELAELYSRDVEYLLLKPAESGRHLLTWMRNDEPFELSFKLPEDFISLLETLQKFEVQRIHVHHTKGVDASVWNLARELGVAYDFTVHDYYSICPQVSLTNLQNHYCGEPDDIGCNQCLSLAPAPGRVDIQSWRSTYAEFLEKADRVFAPSVDVVTRLNRYLPDLHVIPAPHPEDIMAPVPSPAPLAEGGTLRIAVLGALSPVKGPDVLEECAVDAKARKMPLEFHLFGFAYRSLVSTPKANLHVHGPYSDDEIHELFERVKPHLVWFPAQWPETYSYTLSACLKMGIPVVAPDIGAFRERLCGRAWSWTRPWNTKPVDWNNFFGEIRRQNFIAGVVPPLLSECEKLRENIYSDSYLAPFNTRVEGNSSAQIDSGIHSVIGRFVATTSKSAQNHSLKSGVVLPVLKKIRASRWLRFWARRIPQHWQSWVKSWLLGQR